MGSIFSKLVAGVLSITVVVVAYVALHNSQNIVDWWLLRNYEPPADVVQLADDTTMTDLGRRYFFVYRPQLLDRDTFWQKCSVSEASIILGCYISRQGIYIYDVRDERLAGIRQVTAAHEMLHVAYERLSVAERQRIDELTLAHYQSLDNERLKETVEVYRTRDPSIVANELHSILPTEVRDLPDELNQYYRQYFDDRLAVVGFSEQYVDVFEEARRAVGVIDEQLQAKRADIDRLQADLEVRADNLQQRRQELESLIASDQIELYNAQVPVFNNLVGEYNQLVAQLSNQIDNYNQLVSERNQATVAQKNLYDLIDSRPPMIDTTGGGGSFD
jgi:uncharacterized protein YukE